MRKMLAHLLSSPFVLVTSTAALIHSSWTLAVVFGGLEPPSWSGPWIAWLIPGLLLAISIDVGLLQISVEMKSGKRDRNRMAGFILLASAMFILQLAYTTTHFPILALAPGVRADWAVTLAFFRDSLIVVGPALLPIGITLHTFSTADDPAPVKETATALVPQFECGYCGKTFTTQQGLASHTRHCTERARLQREGQDRDVQFELLKPEEIEVEQ